MNKTKPSVKLVDISDNREQAWKFSRPSFDHSKINMEEIGAMDMSLNSTCMLTFEIESSLIFRDWLFSIRPIFPWARSSRSAPLTEENCSISAEFDTGWESIKSVLENIENGKPQDQAREGLPMTMSTAFTITMDFRTVCGMLKSMENIDKDMYSVYGNLFNAEILDIPGYLGNNVKSFEDSYLMTTDEFAQGISFCGEMIHGTYTMKYALAAQFLRQSNSTIKTGIWNHIKENGYHCMKLDLQLDAIAVCFYTQKSSYDKLMRLRSHWFADWSNDMWGRIVGEYVEKMTTKEFWDFIPNGNGKRDPYYRDMISRVTGEEHNLPCPIMLEHPALVEYRLETHGDNPVIRKYMDLVKEGFIIDNPNNELRKQYNEL